MASHDLDLLHAARTEDLEDNQISQLAVLGQTEKDVVKKLKFSGSHLLQGARGIGKSMLLRETESELDRDFSTNRSLAVYVNFKTSTLLEGVRADNKDAFQIWVGAKILQAIYDKLLELDLVSKSSETDPFNRIFGVKSVGELKQALQDKIHLLQQLSQSDDKKTIIEKLWDDFLDKINDISYVNEIIADYSLRRVVFLFDEAAHTFIPSQQEVFFEIFKLLHGGNVAVKAAVYPSITSYGKNFEVGHDANLISLGEFEAGSQGRDNARKMYRELLTKRLPVGSSELKKIFNKGEILDHCIYLASGNPRAFLHLFNRVYEKGYTNRALSLATQEYVDEELLPYHFGLAKRLPKFAHHVKMGIDIIREFVIPEIRIKNNREKKTKYQSAFFTMQRDMASNLKLALDLLCYSGILSKQGTIKIAGRQTGQRYMVHLALLYTEKAFVSNDLTEVMQMLSKTDYREFSSADKKFNDFLEELNTQADACPNCSADLPVDAKFCPSCGNKVEAKSIIGALLDDSIRELSISDKIATRLEEQFKTVGDIIHATREEIMEIKFIKEVRSKIIKNAAEEYISG